MPVINAFRIMKFVITALAIGLTASCSSQVTKLDINPELSGKRMTDLQSQDVANEESSFSIAMLNDLVQQPDIRVAEASLRAAKQSMVRVEADSMPTVNFSADGGIVTEPEDLQPRINPVLSVARTLDDGGLQQAELEIAKLNLKLAQNDLYIRMDEKIATALEAYLLEKYVEEVDRELNSFAKYYDEKKDDIEQAVAFGAVSKSEFLELQQSLLALDERRLNLADLKTKITLLRSSTTQKTLSQRPDILSPKKIKELFNTYNLPFVENAKIRERIAEQQIVAAESSGELQVASIARLSGSQDANRDVQAFAGIQITFPVFDGGRLDADIMKLKEDAKSLSANSDFVSQSFIEQMKAYSDNQRILDSKLKLNRSQVEIAGQRVSLQKELLTSGQVKLSEIVSSVISELQLKIQYIDLDLQVRLAQLQLLKEAGASCVLIDACNELELYAFTSEHG